MLFLLCILIPMGITFLYSYHHVGHQIDEQNFRRLHQQVRTTSLSIYERLLFLRTELSLLSSRLPLDDMTPKTISPYVQDFFKGRDFNRFNNIFFMKDSFAINVYGETHFRPELSPQQIKVLKTGRGVLLTHNQGQGYPLLMMVMPIESNKPEKGVLCGEISAEYLWGIGFANALPPMTDLYILDSKQRLLIASVRLPEKCENMLSSFQHSKNGTRIDWTCKGQGHVAAWRNLFLEGQFSVPEWKVILSQSENDIRTSLQGFKILFPMFSLLGFLVVLLISAITIRRSLEPLQELRKATRTIASGRFDSKAEISSGDEFEELADDFNRMGAELQRQFRILRLNAEIGRSMATIMDAGILADKVLESICAHLDVEGGFLGWCAQEADVFSGTGSYGLSGRQKQILVNKLLGDLNHENTCSCPGNQHKLTQPYGQDFASAAGFDSALCISLQFSDQLTGMLLVFKNGAEPISKNTQKVLSAVVNELSVSLSNIHSISRFLESEKKFRSIFENSAAGIALIDTQGRFVQANPSLCSITGYLEKELQEKKSTDIASSQSRQDLSRIYKDLKNGKKKTGFLEESYIRKDGQIVWVMASHSLLRDQSGKPMFYIDLIQDISEIKQMREKNDSLEKQLQRAQKMEAIGTLAGGIAHDFNNILMAIMGYTELAIMHSKETDPCRPMLDQVIKASRRASGLVKQILTFSRHDTQEKELLSLTPLVKESLKFIKATLPARIKIIEDYQSKMDLIKADPTQINQLVMNLCTNAYHAMKDKEHATLRVKISTKSSLPDHLAGLCSDDSENSSQWVCLLVSDTGCGIDSQHIERIFEPYFTTKPPGEGTGLGLAVVHGIMSKSGGHIDVQSNQGQGTSIELFFPAEKNSCEFDQKQETAVVPGKERLMLVDDEAAIIDLEQQLLEKLGYQVESYTEPEKALKAFQASPDSYDLLITDKSMPEMGGYELAAAFRAVRKDFPIIISSGFHGKDQTGSDAGLAGKVCYLQKPLGYKKLSEAIRNILDGNETNQ